MLTPSALAIAALALAVLAGTASAFALFRITFVAELPQEALERLAGLEAAWVRTRLHLEGLVEELETLSGKVERKRAQARAAQQRVDEKQDNRPPTTRAEVLRAVREKTGVYT